jgi:hypothetical protein
MDLFGMDRLPSPNFSQPVAWLRLGEQQLHLFESESPAPRSHHFALDVDDFEVAYRKAKELGLLVSTLDRSVITTIRRVADERPQSGEAASATLYHAAGDASR